MNIEQYKQRLNLVPTTPHRVTCSKCWKAIATCFCSQLKPFVSPVSFVIIQHLDEARNPIATARMAHLSITNSALIIDKDFSGNTVVNELIKDQSQRHLMLYPSDDALPIDQIFEESTMPDARSPVFWLLDTKWSYAPKMLRQSPALRHMQKVKFNPAGESLFQIRKQPHPNCMSTIESMHFVIELFLRHHGRQMVEHHTLIDVFQSMVQQQIKYSIERNDQRHLINKTRRRRIRQAKQ